MNKKLMTLGVAAAVGLAGFAALPVIAASVFEKEPKEATVKKIGDKFYATRPLVFTGVLNADNTAVTKSELLGYLKETKAQAISEQDDDDAAKAHATYTASGAHNTFTVKGTLEDIQTNLAAMVTELTGAGATDEDRLVAAKVTNVTLEPSDKVTFNVTKLYNGLVDFVKAFKNAKVSIKLNNAQTEATDFTGSEKAADELNGKVTVSKIKVAKFATKAEKENVKNLGISYNEAIVAGEVEQGTPEKPEVNPEDKKDDAKKAEETTAGDKTKAADKKTLKAPDTSIVK